MDIVKAVARYRLFGKVDLLNKESLPIASNFSFHSPREVSMPTYSRGIQIPQIKFSRKWRKRKKCDTPWYVATYITHVEVRQFRAVAGEEAMAIQAFVIGMKK